MFYFPIPPFFMALSCLPIFFDTCSRIISDVSLSSSIGIFSPLVYADPLLPFMPLCAMLVSYVLVPAPTTPASTSKSYTFEMTSSIALESFVPDPGNLDASSSTSRGSETLQGDRGCHLECV